MFVLPEDLVLGLLLTNHRTTVKDRIDFLKTKDVCLGCLTHGQSSKEYRKRLTCEICQQRHPRLSYVKKKQEDHSSKKAEDGEVLLL